MTRMYYKLQVFLTFKRMRENLRRTGIGYCSTSSTLINFFSTIPIDSMVIPLDP